MYCGKCGTKLEKGKAFCPKCGTKTDLNIESKPVSLPLEQENTPQGFVEKIMSKFTTPQLIAICSAIVAVIAAGIIIPVAITNQEQLPVSQPEEYNYPIYDYDEEDNESYDDYTETIDEIDLSGEYDEVIACTEEGSPYYDYEHNEPVYQFVAKQEQSSSSVKTKVGIIKNRSQWIIPLTDNNPLLDSSENRISGSVYDKTKGYSGNLVYLKKGCFLGTKNYEEKHGNVHFNQEEPIIIYNSEANKSIDLRNIAKGICDQIWVSVWDNSASSAKQVKLDSNMIVFYIIHDRDDNGLPLYANNEYNSHAYTTVYSLNLDTLEYKKLFEKDFVSSGSSHYYQADSTYYDGLFLLTCFGEQYYHFFDINGNEKFNLDSYVKEYKSIELKDKSFENGEFHFYVKNSLGNKYLITIDTNGKEISNEAV